MVRCVHISKGTSRHAIHLFSSDAREREAIVSHDQFTGYEKGNCLSVIDKFEYEINRIVRWGSKELNCEF